MCDLKFIELKIKKLEKKKIFIYKKREILDLHERDINNIMDYYRAVLFDYDKK